MNIHCGSNADAMSIVLSDADVAGSDEVASGVLLDFDLNGQRDRYIPFFHTIAHLSGRTLVIMKRLRGNAGNRERSSRRSCSGTS